MSTPRIGRLVPLAVLVVATVALMSSVAWVFTAGGSPANVAPWHGRPLMGTGYGPMMSGSGMMPGMAGSGPVTDIEGARQTAQRFADRWGLHVGEVMQFSNGYYAELLDPAGNRATEALVDPAGGAVMIEPGPAMMWNTVYAMMPGRFQQGTSAVSPEQARTIADQWLAQNRIGLSAAEADAFPGYYTVHTQRGDQIDGMLSVNAYTGAVWYHTWHGTFIRMQEPAER